MSAGWPPARRQRSPAHRARQGRRPGAVPSRPSRVSRTRPTARGRPRARRIRSGRPACGGPSAAPRDSSPLLLFLVVTGWLRARWFDVAALVLLVLAVLVVHPLG